MVDLRRAGAGQVDGRIPRWPPTWAWVVSLACAVIGLGASAYLTYAHYSDPTSLLCSDSGTVNCTKVTTSSQSQVFGVFPVAVLGLAYFFVMTGVCTPWLWRRGSQLIDRARLVGAAAGVAMVFYLVYAELFQIDAVCLWCTVIHIVTVVMFIVVVAAEAARR